MTPICIIQAATTLPFTNMGTTVLNNVLKSMQSAESRSSCIKPVTPPITPTRIMVSHRLCLHPRMGPCPSIRRDTFQIPCLGVLRHLDVKIIIIIIVNILNSIFNIILSILNRIVSKLPQTLDVQRLCSTRIICRDPVVCGSREAEIQVSYCFNGLI